MSDIPSREPASGAREAPVFTCTACAQRWLVAGLEDGEMYTCRACGHSFRARRDDAGPRAAGPRRLPRREVAEPAARAGAIVLTSGLRRDPSRPRGSE